MREVLGALPGVRFVQTVAGVRLERRHWIDREGFRLGAQASNVLRLPEPLA